ncbi:Nickel transport system permease protein NikB [Sporomusa ovata DSM 2662]|uniref:Nickel transport system permease protein NikB (TC 3.A.1.5.3) n=1 Tax=Sporomusa ovata TaxID=2378 RepID=A0A0U1KRV6_9FIRM|nr:ABC transporter permease subunit [Sporomusa ovata]EQB24961.1 nickel transport system permease protein NikB [Sporomusa ovata DSM 2662]CQR70158.1 Nickel transport system permease protein NikB (TC 3.A.1.5.3) [Sporomusa ovata]
MLRSYILKRLVNLLFVLIGITLLSFVITNLSPIDPAEAYARRIWQNAGQEQIEQLRQEMGFYEPIYVQYWRWVTGAIQGNFGQSLVSGRPVREDIMTALPVTLLLVAVAALLILLVSIPLGILSALYRNKWFDHLIRMFTLAGISLPGFWLGFILIYYFAVEWKLAVVVGFGKIEHVLLPAVTLALPVISMNIRLLRTNMLEIMNKDFVLYAKARGLNERRIVWKHVFKNAVSPLVTLLGQTIGHMVAGAVIVESVFSWPGMGLYVVAASMDRDFPAINAYVLIMAVIVVTSNLLADVINIWLNPAFLQEGEK